VAREASDIVLLERRLSVLHAGIVAGRKSFGNVLKYLLMGTSSNFGNMFSMAGAALLLPFLPMLPIQILLNNFLYDFAQITIPTDNIDPSYIRRPQRWNIGLIRNFMLVIGPVSSVYDFLTFFVLLHFFRFGETLFHTGWFVESLATQTLVLFVIRTVEKPWKNKPSARAGSAFPLVFRVPRNCCRELPDDCGSCERQSDAAISSSVGSQEHVSGAVDRIHGWFWENTGDRDVTIKINVSGFFPPPMHAQQVWACSSRTSKTANRITADLRMQQIHGFTGISKWTVLTTPLLWNCTQTRYVRGRGKVRSN
jgi:Cation transporting ATPase, C-terminus